MAIEIRVPTLGESITEATVGKWYKKAGDHVEADEPIVELETDKVSIEVPSPVNGTISDIMADQGEDVKIGAILGLMTEVTAPAVTAATDTDQQKGQASVTSLTNTGHNQSLIQPTAQQQIMGISGNTAPDKQKKTKLPHRIKTVPSPQLTATEKTDNITPTSPLRDILSPKPTDESGRETRIPMSRLRRTIAERLQQVQQNTAMLTTFNEVDMLNIMTLRKTYKEAFLEKHGIKLGIMSFFVKAIIQALKDYPAVNAEIDGHDMVFKDYFHIGVAVGTDKGLVVPVLKNADTMNFDEIEKSLSRLADKARSGHLEIKDLQGGTFSLTNGGIYGSMMSTPILNAPQSGILGIHKIQDRPIALDGQVVIRPMMYLALTYDHRIVDGKDAVSFLVRIKESLENPERLFLDL